MHYSQIFRKDDPVLAVALPAETRSELEDLLKALPQEVFLADDSLGWVYQFWQADRKDEAASPPRILYSVRCCGSLSVA